MNYEDREYSLGEIIGRDRLPPDERTGINPYRVVDFWPEATKLHIGEACDGNFGIAMTPAEVDKLIAWLTEWRRGAA